MLQVSHPLNICRASCANFIKGWAIKYGRFAEKRSRPFPPDIYPIPPPPSPNTAWTYRPITVDNTRLINRGSFSAVETNYRSTWSLRVRFQRSSKSGSEGQREGSGYFSHLAFSSR